MKVKPFTLLLAATGFFALVGCGDGGPRDATNDPEVQAMIKSVNEEGKMPAGGPQSVPSASTAPTPAPTPTTP